MKDVIKWSGSAHFTCHDQFGNLKWEETAHNALFDQGEQLIAQVFLQGQALAGFFFGLLTTGVSSPQTDETKTLTNIGGSGVTANELAATNGYSRLTVERSAVGWPTIALNSGDYQATSKTVTWTASANWATPIRWLFMTDQGTAQNTTGNLITLIQLSVDRTINNLDTLAVTYTIKFQ